MAKERPLCDKCGGPIVAHQDVVFPKIGGVEHVDCPKSRKPLARVEPPPLICLVCERPVLYGDQVAVHGHDLLHADCYSRLRSISGASGPSANRVARARINDPFAHAQLLATCAEIWRDAADVRAMSRHIRHRPSEARTAPIIDNEDHACKADARLVRVPGRMIVPTLLKI